MVPSGKSLSSASCRAMSNSSGTSPAKTSAPESLFMSAMADASASPQLDRVHEMSWSIHALIAATVPRPATPQPVPLPARGTCGAGVLRFMKLGVDVVDVVVLLVDGVLMPNELCTATAANMNSVA